jgi:hypothetical protein
MLVGGQDRGENITIHWRYGGTHVQCRERLRVSRGVEKGLCVIIIRRKEIGVGSVEMASRWRRRRREGVPEKGQRKHDRGR